MEKDDANAAAVLDDLKSGFTRFEVEKISTMDRVYRFSPEINVGGVPWKAFVCKVEKEGTDRLFIGLHSITNPSPLWSIDVDIKCIVVNSDISKNIVKKMALSTFKRGNDNWGCRMNDWEDFVNGTEGFINDDKINVEVHFSIFKMRGIRTTPEIDFTDPNEPRHDITLVINGKKIYASKQFLSLHSPVFNAMFYGNFDENDKKEIELKDIDRVEFIEMLYVMYPSCKMITDDTVVFLLKFGDRFQIKILLDLCEEFLISSDLKLSFKLLLSDQFRLVKLQGHCLNQLNTMNDVREIKKSSEYKDISETTKVALLEKMFELVPE